MSSVSRWRSAFPRNNNFLLHGISARTELLALTVSRFPLLLHCHRVNGVSIRTRFRINAHIHAARSNTQAKEATHTIHYHKIHHAKGASSQAQQRQGRGSQQLEGVPPKSTSPKTTRPHSRVVTSATTQQKQGQPLVQGLFQCPGTAQPYSANQCVKNELSPKGP